MPILQPIKPQYCELIASGKKTIEVRKTRPKCELPVKVYIYCTKDGHTLYYDIDHTKVNLYHAKAHSQFAPSRVLNSKVIGEYVCDDIVELKYDEFEGCYMFENCYAGYILDEILSDTCLPYDEIRKYGGDKTLYLWHISDLVIYDKPKELSKFGKECNLDCPSVRCPYWKYQRVNADEWDYDCSCNNIRPLTRPPQSFCYVEEVS